MIIIVKVPYLQAILKEDLKRRSRSAMGIARSQMQIHRVAQAWDAAVAFTKMENVAALELITNRATMATEAEEKANHATQTLREELVREWKAHEETSEELRTEQTAHEKTAQQLAQQAEAVFLTLTLTLTRFTNPNPNPNCNRRHCFRSCRQHGQSTQRH